MRAILKHNVAFIAAALALPLVCYPQSQRSTTEELVFRDAFVLKLHTDGERDYEQRFGRVPYVTDNEVYLFRGDAFGINITIRDGGLPLIAYQRDPAKADVEFAFTQEKSRQGFMMMLAIRNKLKSRLFFDAMMTVPGKGRIYSTSVLPVEPSLSNFESWPHPIVQLVLSSFRVSEESGGTRDGKTADSNGHSNR
jgi:hypothetical protein